MLGKQLFWDAMYIVHCTYVEKKFNAFYTVKTWFLLPHLSLITFVIVIITTTQGCTTWGNVKRFTLSYALWENNSGSNSLLESSASCEGLPPPSSSAAAALVVKSAERQTDVSLQHRWNGEERRRRKQEEQHVVVSCWSSILLLLRPRRPHLSLIRITINYYQIIPSKLEIAPLYSKMSDGWTGYPLDCFDY